MVDIKKRQMKGTDHPLSKLNEAQVREIRRLRTLHIPIHKIATQFAVSFSTIQTIAAGRSWKHVA